MAMIESRNRTLHAYDPSVLETEFTQICKNYKTEFLQLESKLGKLSEHIKQDGVAIYEGPR